MKVFGKCQQKGCEQTYLLQPNFVRRSEAELLCCSLQLQKSRQYVSLYATANVSDHNDIREGKENLTNTYGLDKKIQIYPNHTLGKEGKERMEHTSEP
jgi:hypothetical protein